MVRDEPIQLIIDYLLLIIGIEILHYVQEDRLL